MSFYHFQAIGAITNDTLLLTVTCNNKTSEIEVHLDMFLEINSAGNPSTQNEFLVAIMGHWVVVETVLSI